jgi:radical SAM protein with 4Fe4S-binding SPASM domain
MNLLEELKSLKLFIDYQQILTGKEIFSILQRIVIENHNYCNRSCQFCPNSLHDRKSWIEYMEYSCFKKIIQELKLYEYNNSIMFGRYHEPLADSVVFNRIQYIRKELGQKVRISLNTNADFLSNNNVGLLRDSGLDDMKIMAYLPNGMKYTTEAAISRCLSIAKRVGFEVELKTSIEGRLIIYQVISSEMDISIHAENYGYTGYGSDRAGAVKSLSLIDRCEPCFAPYFEVNIDFDGSVLPCCNFVSTYSKHREYILGNIKESSITSIYNSAEAREFRKRVSDGGSFPLACAKCQYFWPNRLAINKQVAVLP